MTTQKEIIERLKLIVDKQDNLISHFDAQFQQQKGLNDALINRNNLLKEDIEKHKSLLRDMNKSLTQHKNVIAKLKKELEDQLKIQQELHKDYAEIIEKLTSEIEEYESGEAPKKEVNEDIKANGVDLPPKDFERDYFSEAGDLLNNLKEKSEDTFRELSSAIIIDGNDNKFCRNCGAQIKKNFSFCEVCGAKLD